MGATAKSVILIRHVKTEPGAACADNAYDPPISEAGRQEAARLSENLRSRHIKRIYASDSRRAQETAQIIAEVLRVPLELRPQFRELLAITPEALRASEQVVTDALDDITFRHRDSTIAVVAHSGTIRAIARHLLQLPLETYAVPSVGNGSMLVFRSNDASTWTTAN